MSRLTRIGQFFGSLLILAAVVAGIAAGFRFLLHYIFRGVSATVAAAIVAAASTGLLSVVTLVLQRRYERRQAIERQIHDRRVEVYTDFLNHYFYIFGIGEAPRTDAESEQAVLTGSLELAKLTPSLIAWASDNALLTWSHYRRDYMAEAPTNPVAVLNAVVGFESVLLAIRRDLGHSNKEFARGDLLRLWINDIDTVLAPAPPS